MGAAIHDPHAKLGAREFAALGYPKPIVEHKAARERALARFKNVGEKPDEEGAQAGGGEGEAKPKAVKGKKAVGEKKKAAAPPRKTKKRVVESDEEEGEGSE